MGKIRLKFRNLSIRKTICFYMIFFIVVSISLSAITSYICKNTIQKIDEKYLNVGKKYFLTTEEGERLGEGTYILNNIKEYSSEDEKIIKALEIIPSILNPVYSLLCAIIAICLFYNNKIKKPLIELDNASKMVADNNLDFSIKYKSKDEMGRLCSSFEKMRFALLENYKEMWRNVEERKQLNVAFAHELRTPLTILKGYNEILANSDDVQIKNNIKVMKKNVDRMEKYIETMSKMQKLEEMKANIKCIETKEFIRNIIDTIKVIGKENREIKIHYDIHTEEMYVDLDMILQVINNLLSNAIQYANNLIQIILKEDNQYIYIIVQDDGKGFSKKAIENATKPYYTENKESEYNFGLGLYISKIYCELNNGNLQIYNENGACVKISLKKYKS